MAQGAKALKCETARFERIKLWSKVGAIGFYKIQ